MEYFVLIIIGCVVLYSLFGYFIDKAASKKNSEEKSRLRQRNDFLEEQIFRLKRKPSASEQASAFVAERTRLLQEIAALKQHAVSVISVEQKAQALQEELDTHKANLERLLSSHLTSIPWLAGMMADFLTYDLEMQAKYLDWGHDQKRLKKVASIREIRAEARARIEEAKEAIYQLEYLKTLYPALEDVLSTEYQELNLTCEIPEHDPVREYLTREEWLSLSPVQRDQLALDRYIQFHKKTSWQIGRDYELSVAWEYTQKGYTVDTFGSRMKLEDLGRDLIAVSKERILIIQCKYWSKSKTIHEKHLFQLYGTTIMYQIDHPENALPISAVFVTNTALSAVARQVADTLGMTVVENHGMKLWPRIKCNIGHDEFGKKTYIYHLPMDAQYDITQIKDPGEFYASTVQEAVNAGYRRAYKWHGQ